MSKRLKLFLWGPEGSLKTRTALAFPGVFLIDMEGGADWYAEEFGLDETNRILTADPDVVMSEVNRLMTTEHEHRTLILDPFTIYWSAIQKKYQDIFLTREKKSPGFKMDYYKIQPSDWGIIKAEIKELVRKLTMLDMNVIVTAHQKKLYAEGEMMKVIGDTFDGEKSLPYMFDVIVRCYQKDDGSFWSKCIKDRTGSLPKDEFPTSYQVYADMFGKAELERPAVAIEYATPEQIEELGVFFTMHQMDATKIKRQLAKYGVADLGTCPKAAARKLIDAFQAAYEIDKGRTNANS